jgi:hypothetical protein
MRFSLKHIEEPIGKLLLIIQVGDMRKLFEGREVQ